MASPRTGKGSWPLAFPFLLSLRSHHGSTLWAPSWPWEEHWFRVPHLEQELPQDQLLLKDSQPARQTLTRCFTSHCVSHAFFLRLLYSCPGAALTKHHTLGNFRNRDWLHPVLQPGSSRSRCWCTAGLVLPEAVREMLSPALPQVLVVSGDLCCSLTCRNITLISASIFPQLLPGCLSVSSRDILLRGTPTFPQNDLILNNYLCNYLISK